MGAASTTTGSIAIHEMTQDNSQWAMSAFGTKQTSKHNPAMSAFDPLEMEPLICSCWGSVQFNIKTPAIS
jgi:hypothetical protein